jgi:hypothetical protein
VKKLFWFLATTIVLLGAVSTPVHLHADGNPPPTCLPQMRGCKP